MSMSKLNDGSLANLSSTGESVTPAGASSSLLDFFVCDPFFAAAGDDGDADGDASPLRFLPLTLGLAPGILTGYPIRVLASNPRLMKAALPRVAGGGRDR